MNELRWILLGAGLLLILGIYLWGLHARRRAAAPAAERTVRVEPARVVTVASEPAHESPAAGTGWPAADQPEPMPPDDEDDAEPQPPRRVPGGVRREPRFEPLPATRAEPRNEPMIGGIRAEPQLEPQARGITATRAESPPAASADAARKPAPQRIVALRIVAGSGGIFEGAQLLDALTADGFAFGRYQIFHRLDESGRAIVSLASLKEPGTFDPENMPGMDFRGIALFTVVPGPLPGARAVDELIVTARALAATLGGQLQDERGAPLTLARIGQIREEVTSFERSCAAAPGA